MLIRLGTDPCFEYIITGAVAGKSPPSSSIAPIFNGISSFFFHNFHSFKVLHVRNGNRLAQLLAKYAQGVEQYVSWIEESPCFIKHALSFDVISFQSF